MQPLEYKRKGNKLIINQTQLNEYLQRKLDDLTNLMSNIITALIVVSIMVAIQSFMASTPYLLALILVPILGKGFVYSHIHSSLHKRFDELLDL